MFHTAVVQDSYLNKAGSVVSPERLLPPLQINFTLPGDMKMMLLRMSLHVTEWLHEHFTGC